MKNLPLPRTSFVGRASELEAIDRLLEDPDCRLLTLVGPGGAGKTRLALEAAARRVDRYPHGVHFVPLASVSSPDFLAPALADSIQFSVDGAHSGFSAQEQLLDYLSERSTLLVLDNFEHLVEGSGLLSEVIERAPHVELLTTSRERLKVQSEWVFDVEGLGLAENGNGSASAVRLFVERAKQVAPGFALDDAARRAPHLPARRRDAARHRARGLMGVRALLRRDRGRDRGQHRLPGDVDARRAGTPPQLAGGHRPVVAPAHRRAAQRVLAAVRVPRQLRPRRRGRGHRRRPAPPLRARRESLLRRPDFGRFELHELLRQYAAEQLRLSPGEETDARERHAHHYAAMLLERKAALMGPELAAARDELRGELDNLRAAAEWTLAEDDDYTALEVLEALNVFLWMHSWFEAAETLEQLARTAGFDADDPASANAVALAAAMYSLADGARLGYDPAAEELAARCLPVLRARKLKRELALCLSALGLMAVYRDVYPDAVAYLEEAAEIAGAVGDKLTESGALIDLGWRLLQNDLEATREAFEGVRVIVEELGGPLLRAYTTSKLGLLADAEERYADALRLHTEATELFASVGDAGGTGYTLSRASLSAFGVGDYPEALRLGRAGYEAFSEVNHRWGMIAALCRIGFAALALGDHAEARQRFDEALDRAHDAQAVSLELLALSGIGACLAEDPAEQERAAVILTFAMGHEQLPPSYSYAARPALERLEAELPPEQLAAAREEAAAATIEELERTALV